MPPPQHFFPKLHQLSDRMPSISDEFLKLGGDKRNGFRPVELEAPGETFLSKKPCLEQN